MSKVEKALEKVLDKDELVLWSGKPAPFTIMDKYIPELVRNCIIVLIVFVPFIIMGLGSPGANMQILYVTLIVTLAALQFSLIGYYSYQKNCTYHLTNKNIIVYVSESKFMKYPYNAVDKIETVPQGNGTKSIRIGKIVGKSMRFNMEYAVNCIFMDAAGNTKGYCVLFNLPDNDVEAVLELIEQQKGRFKVVA